MAEGVLQIVLLEGRNLPALDFGGTSDPYVIIQIGSEKRKSTTKRKTLVPVWLEQFEFNVKERDKIDFEIWDEDRGSKDDFMCSITLVLSEVYSGKEMTSWYPCFTKKKKPAGEVRLRTLFTKGKNPLLIPLYRTGKMTTLSEEKGSGHGHSWQPRLVRVIENYLILNDTSGADDKKNRVCINIEKATIKHTTQGGGAPWRFRVLTPIDGDPEPHLEAPDEIQFLEWTNLLKSIASGKYKQDERIIGYLTLTVIGATHLPNTAALGRMADPYCMVIVEQDQQRTKILKDTNEPIWKETFKFMVTSTATDAMILVIDGDVMAKGDPIARLHLPLNEFANQNNVVKELPLEILATGRGKNANHTQTQTDSKISLEISYSVKKYERGNADKAVFGIPIHTILARPNNQGLPIPRFVHEAITLLRKTSIELDGIFRISGPQMEITQFRDTIDEGKEVDFSTAESMHTVTGLLKLYFRELPDPLLTFMLHQQFIDAMDLPSEGKILETLASLIKQLPKENYVCLKELTLFLYEITQHSSVNRMTAENLGIVFGPNLLRSQGEDSVTAMLTAPRVYAVMLKHTPTLFS